MAGKPGRKGLQAGIQRPGKIRIPGSTEIMVEVAFELEHVAKVPRAWEAKTAKHVKRNRLILHFPAERTAHLIGDFGACQVLPRNPDSLADIFSEIPSRSAAATSAPAAQRRGPYLN